MKYNMNIWAAFTIVAIWLAGILGWVLNLVTIFDSSFSPITGPLVLRIIGVFIAPIGAVLGYI